MARYWRIGLEILGLIAVLALLSLIFRGLGPALPALGGIARVLLNPIVLVAVVVFVLLLRTRRDRP